MLSQSEAETLIKLKEKRLSKENYTFPMPGDNLTIPIVSFNNTESFLLDLSRGRIKISQCTYQERHQVTIILVRLDVDGPPHTNPEVESVPLEYLNVYNGLAIPCPHLHLYVENFMDRWAVPASNDEFPNTSNLYATLQDFFRYCNIIDPPIVQRGLFT